MAVAASAGYPTQLVQDDRDGVDATVRDGGITVDIQLKATSVPDMDEEFLRFDLDVKTYNKLRTDRSSPGYLLVAVLPPQRTSWLGIRKDHIRLNRAAYYLEITGMPGTGNSATIRLNIPLSNKLTEAALKSIMAEARRRALV